MRYLPVLSLALLCLAVPAAAQDKVGNLTPKTVEKFILSMTNKTKPGGRLNDERVMQYLTMHLFDLGRFSSNITFRIPGHEEQVRTVALDKADFIKNVIAGRQTMRNHTSEVAVRDVVIATNGNEATFKTRTIEKGEMPIEGDYVAFNGETACDQALALDGNIPIILSADCKSILIFQE